MKRLLLIDSGATKADWAALTPDRAPQRFQTVGIHPFFLSEDAIRSALQQARHMAGAEADQIFFYGTGCKAESSRRELQALFRAVFPKAEDIEIETDVLGAARALCGSKPGIACILGTGSNSVWYDGSSVVQNAGGLGYILGDEGSGAVLGRELIVAWLNRELPPELLPAFESGYPVSKEEVILAVYRSETPSRFLASFAPFLSRHIGHPFAADLVQRQFELFVRRCVLDYPPAKELPIHFTGSVAWYFRSILEAVLEEAQLQSGIFLAAPMEGLIGYHTERG
jgi:glucosamine kinase